jgi:hypothetical protein
MTPTGLEHTPETRQKQGSPDQVAQNQAHFRPDSGQIDADLCRLIDAWPAATAAVKRQVLALLVEAPAEE